MRSLDPRRGALCVAWLCLALASQAAAPARVAVHLEIQDALTGSGLAVSVHREVAPGTNALTHLESVVTVEYRRYTGVGVLVTALCGVAAPDGMFWALSVDGARSERGIADLDIEADTHIRWDLVRLR